MTEDAQYDLRTQYGLRNLEPTRPKMPFSHPIGKLAEALAKAQGEMTGAVKGKKNPFFKSTYAPLDACWAVARDPLCKNGLTVIQTTDLLDDGTTVLVTTLAHSSGESVSGRLPLRPAKDDSQGMGSAITYARRQGFCAITGVTPADEDDDGEASMGRDEAPKRGKRKPLPDDPAPPPEEGYGAIDPEKRPLNRDQQKLLFTFLEEKGLSKEALRGVMKGELGLEKTGDILARDLPKLTEALTKLAKANAEAVDEVFPEGPEAA